MRTIRSLTVRQVVALGVTAMGISTVLGPDVGVDPTRRPLLGRLHPATFPTAFRVVDLPMGLALLVLAPKLLRGIRTAMPL